MKRNAVRTALLAMAAVLLLGSCDALFVNYYKEANLGQVGTTAVRSALTANASDDQLIATLAQQTASESFYESLAEDPVLMAELITRLDDIADAAVTMTANVEAAINTIVQIKVQTTRSMELISNFGSLLGSYMRATSRVPAVDSADIKARLEAIIPADITQTDLADAVDGIAETWPWFVQMATLMRATSNPPVFVGLSQDQQMSLLQISVISALLNAFTPQTGYATIGAAVAAAWFELKTNPNINLNAYFGAAPDLEDILTNPANTYRVTIVTFATAAGLDLDDLAAQFN